MSLNMQEIPTRFMLHELAARYGNLIVCGYAERAPNEDGVNLCFAHGSTIMAMGLTKVMEQFLAKEMGDSFGEDAEDIP